MKCAAAYTYRGLLTPESWTASSTITVKETFVWTRTELFVPPAMIMYLPVAWCGGQAPLFTNFTCPLYLGKEKLPLTCSMGPCALMLDAVIA